MAAQPLGLIPHFRKTQHPEIRSHDPSGGLLLTFDSWMINDMGHLQTPCIQENKGSFPITLNGSISEVSNDDHPPPAILTRSGILKEDQDPPGAVGFASDAR